MTDPFKSIDEIITTIRQECDARIKSAEDAKLAAEVKATFLEDHLNKALQARTAAERITMALITQFSIVEKVFAEAKELALKVKEGQKPDIPEELAAGVKAYNDATQVSQEVKPTPTELGGLEAHIEGELHQ